MTTFAIVIVIYILVMFVQAILTVRFTDVDKDVALVLVYTIIGPLVSLVWILSCIRSFILWAIGSKNPL